MGCCPVYSNNEGENYVINAIKNPSFKLNKLLFEDIRVQIDNILKQTKKVSEIKQQLTDFLIISNDSESNKMNNDYITYIIDEIFLAFKKNNFSYNKLLLLLFPYLLHPENEYSTKILYDILYEESRHNLTKATYSKLFEEYITNCTSKLTFSLWQCCNSDSIKKALDELNGSIYTPGNIQKMCEKFNSEIYFKLHNENKDIITEDMFISAFNKYCITDYQDIRGYFINEYTSK